MVNRSVKEYILNKKTKTIIWIIAGVLLAGLIFFLLSDVFAIGAKSIAFSELKTLLTDGKIKEMQLNAFVWEAIGADGTRYVVNAPSVHYYADWAAFEAEMVAVLNGVTVKFANPNQGSVLDYIFPALSIGIGLILLFVLFRQMSGGRDATMGIGKSKAQVQNNMKVRFSDVAGAEEEKEELKEVVEFLKSPKKFSDLGARIPSGVLLVGPPGTGKTLFAKAVAGEAGVPFFSVSGSDFVEMYVGVGASRVRDLFDVAKKNQPCIIFIDEIDAVGRRRGAGLGGGHDEREQTLNQILVAMDGFEENQGIIVMAATNRDDILDPALLRPGRFDRKITVNLPDVKGREQILKVHARNKPMAPDVNFKTVARITAGFSGAELANLLNEAAILTARAGKKLIGNHELYEGINKVVMGPAKKSHVVTETDKRTTAYHEAGHAILACLCKNCDPVHEVTIIPRGNAAGYTMTRPDSDDAHVTLGELNDRICMALGGRVAEELVLHDIATGASGDIQHVTAIARRMVTQWGMSEKLGLVAYDNDHPVFMGMEYGHSERGCSPETAAIIDQEVRRIISEAHERARKLLKENRSVLDNMARVLVEKETIYNEEVLMLVKGADYKEVIAYMEEREGKPRENVFSVAVNPAKEAEKQSQEKSEEVVEATEQSTAAEAPEETKEDKE
ncbi:MAG: ATP-dependent zinc metalloprotease FtsH [Clostridia bacterium]|nr:ATP-dependent zinc metalloprotease FtsH [Clostridia bacterium]